MTMTTVGFQRRTSTGVAVGGMLLIAATAGMVRFGVGLFVPSLAAARPELAGSLGWAGAAQFTSYCVAAVVAVRIADRRPRTGLLLAGATASLGCLGVAVATDPVVFVLALLVGGMGCAFAAAALVPIIDAVVVPSAAATAQSMANSGTAVGIIGAGLVAFSAISIGPAWTVIALACAAAAVATWYPVRTRTDLAACRHPLGRAPAARPYGAWQLLLVPGAAAVIAGAGSSLVWTFGPLLMTASGPVAPDRVGWLWIALGLGGVLGALTGALVDRTGRRGGWLACVAILALASAGVALSMATGSAGTAYASMAVFGAAYMGLSGVLILWARHAWPSRAGAATSILFIALSVGQALGSAGFETVRQALEPTQMTLVAASLCIAAGLVTLRTKP